jgi:hypothetical protein
MMRNRLGPRDTRTPTSKPTIATAMTLPLAKAAPMITPMNNSEATR